jgi:hypothetical protein
MRLRGEQAEKLAAELTGWFAEHNSLERAEFTQIFERCAEAD